jgi:hypothetical protein
MANNSKGPKASGGWFCNKVPTHGIARCHRLTQIKLANPRLNATRPARRGRDVRSTSPRTQSAAPIVAKYGPCDIMRVASSDVICSTPEAQSRRPFDWRTDFCPTPGSA